MWRARTTMQLMISESKQTRKRFLCRERRAPPEVDIPAPPNRVGYVTKEPEVNTRGVGALHARAKQREEERRAINCWIGRRYPTSNRANRADKLSDNIFPSLLVMIYTIVAGNPF